MQNNSLLFQYLKKRKKNRHLVPKKTAALDSRWLNEFLSHEMFEKCVSQMKWDVELIFNAILFKLTKFLLLISVILAKKWFPHVFH